MALRPKLDWVARRDSGLIAANTAASLQAWVVNQDGSTGAAAPLWDAATGGTSTTSAVNPDANGVYQRWLPNPGRYKIVETIDGVVRPDRIFTATVAIVEPWTDMTPLLNTFVIDAADPPQYQITPEGMVNLRGHITRVGGSTLPIYNLPAGYRPALPALFYTVTAAMAIQTNGNMSTPSSATDFHLDNIQYRAEG